MGKWTGRVYENFEPGRVTGTLYDFAIDSAALHPEHCAWLDKHVVPALAGGGSVGISGLASRSGSAAHNLALSKRRANAVLAYLRRKVRKHVAYRVNWLEGTGEESAKFLGQKDGTEDSLQRAVVVAAWHRPTPPPPPRSISKP
jgi:outer membrane protein OmpA-like peptidoglycan-associated protein